jgi:ankyrin repeat protein
VSEKIKTFKSVSVQKKCQAGYNMTPLHVACINPNPEVLRMFLEVNPDFNMTDTNMRRPIHYAAANENPGALKLLLEKGANLMDVDTQKTTPLHAAAMASRATNVKLILEECPGLIKLRDRSGKTAMAYACERQDFETIKVLF